MVTGENTEEAVIVKDGRDTLRRVGEIALSIYAVEDLKVKDRRNAPQIENLNPGIVPKSALKDRAISHYTV